MIGTFAMVGIIALGLLFLASALRGLQEILVKRRRRRQFSEFEDVLTSETADANQARKFFSGEVKLEQEVYVFIPDTIGWEPFANPVATALKELEIGTVIRGNKTDDSCGFDVVLNDFVKGVDLIRKILTQLDAPQGTLIEYSGGDLPIYDE